MPTDQQILSNPALKEPGNTETVVPYNLPTEFLTEVSEFFTRCAHLTLISASAVQGSTTQFVYNVPRIDLATQIIVIGSMGQTQIIFASQNSANPGPNNYTWKALPGTSNTTLYRVSHVLTPSVGDSATILTLTNSTSPPLQLQPLNIGVYR
jgi:hypothetical protein